MVLPFVAQELNTLVPILGVFVSNLFVPIKSGMVRLRNVGLSRSYRRSLVDASNDMMRRLVRKGRNVTAKTPHYQIDKWLEAAVEECHREGERLYWVTLGVLGIQRGLRLSGSLLRGAWRAIQGWRSLRTTKSRIPITAYVLEGVVLEGIFEGWKTDGWERQQMWASALALWLGFYCLLRPSEVLQLKVGDLSFSGPGTKTRDPGMVVVVRTPKTKRIWHRQFVLCREERLERWLRWWVVGKSKTRPLFGLTRYLWVKFFNIFLSRLNLEGGGYTLGSLRAGGATHHFRCHGNLGELQFLGRWTSQNTLQFYLKKLSLCMLSLR